MSPSTPPSPEAFIDSFPNMLPKIEGPPTYDSLAQLKDLIKANATSVTSTRGGGTHGYLGIVLSPGAYATIDPSAFVVPANPGTHPVFLNNTPTAAQFSEAVRTHEESLREWREYTNLEQALKKQITQAIDPVYLRALKDRNAHRLCQCHHSGYATVSFYYLRSHFAHRSHQQKQEIFFHRDPSSPRRDRISPRPDAARTLRPIPTMVF